MPKVAVKTIFKAPIDKTPRRVRRDEVVRGLCAIEPDGVAACLECWKVFMHGDSDRDLGVGTMSGLAGNTDGYGFDSGEAQQAYDMRIGGATDAMIDSLKRLHIWAIYKLCSVASPWDYPRADILVIGPEAMDALKEKLKNNVATAILF